TQKRVKDAVDILVADFLCRSTKKDVAMIAGPSAKLIIRSLVGVFDRVPLGTPGYWLQKAVLFKVQEREYPTSKSKKAAATKQHQSQAKIKIDPAVVKAIVEKRFGKLATTTAQ